MTDQARRVRTDIELRRGLTHLRLSLEDHDPLEHDAVLELLLNLQAEKDRLAELEAEVKEVVQQWIETTGQEVLFVREPGKVSPEDRRWYVGKRTRVQQRSKEPTAQLALLEDALEACGIVREHGLYEEDLLLLVQSILSSNWCKQGGFREVAGDEAWERHFERTEQRVLKDGEPTKAQRELLEDRPFYSGSGDDD